MTPILEIRNCIKQYPAVRAVDGVSFSIQQGICFGLLGPNGAGKTTTIEMIEGIIRPTQGTILYKGKERTASFKQEAGIQLQNTELPQYLTVKETLSFFRSFYPRKTSLDALIAQCRLEDILKRDNAKISGGQKQRLLLAIALANDPELIFLDEPTTGLDPQARRHLWEIIADIKARGKTVVLTTHYMEEAQSLCDIIAIMDHGKIITEGTPRSLLDKHCKGSSILLRSTPDTRFLDKMGMKYFQMEDYLEVQTDSVTDTVASLVENGIDLTGMTVRSQNLEDLFLKLTGTELRG
ncbi:MAG: ABC transporter ATP-binding protein [Spirochaetota bacterium]